MKKLLVALLAVSTVSVFAGTDNMVRFTNIDNANTARSFDFSMSADDADNKTTAQNIALNYARAFNQFQVGVTYRSYAGESGGNKNAGTTMGLSGYYNLESDLGNTCYVALHYDMHASSKNGYSFNGGDDALGEDDTATTITLEYGHRWTVGTGWGFNLTYAPSVSYMMTSYKWDVSANDDTNGKAYSALGWNWLKFDVMF